MAVAVRSPAAAMSLTNELAAADPKHDFEHERGTATMQSRLKAIVKKILGGGRESVQFSDLYNKYKELGTVEKPSFAKARNIWNEWKGFEMVTGIKKEEFFNAEGDKVGEFQTSTAHTYTFRALRIKTGGSYEAGLTAEVLFTKMVEQVPDKTDIYFTIDAVNCSFYELLTEESNKGAAQIPTKAFHYCMFREGDNDSAGKVSLDTLEAATRDGHKVKLKVHRDTGTSLVTYPAYTDNLEDPSSQFNSIYTIEVKGAGAGIGSTLTTFKSKGFNETVEIAKGKKEEHPNAVNTLVPKLAQVLKLFEKESKVSPSTKHLYFTALQRKRSGDWLPVLATLERGRIPTVPAFARVATATEDILCGAFALNRGGDVILTLRNTGAGGAMEQWIVYCTLKTGATSSVAFQALKAGQLKGEIQAAGVTSVSWTPAGGGAAQVKTLAELVATYQALFSERVKTLWAEVDGTLAELGTLIDSFVANEAVRPASIKSSAELLAKTRAVLRALYKTARFYCLAPKIEPTLRGGAVGAQIGEIAAIESAGAAAAIAADEYEATATLFEDVKTIRNTIVSVLKGGTKSATVLTPEQALSRGLNTIAEGPTGNLASAQRREQQKYIDSFLLFNTSVFIRGNPQTNALGLFELFNKIPEDAKKGGVKTTLKRKFEALRDRMPAADDKKAITLFLKTFEVITYAEPEAAAEFTAEDTSEADVIACIHENDAGLYIEGGAAGEAGGAAAAAAAAEGEEEAPELAEEADAVIPEVEEGAPAPILELPGRNLIESSVFTPGLRVLKSLRTAADTISNLTSMNRFLEAQLPAEGAGGVGGGGGGRTRGSLRGKRVFDLHPFTYLFFYAREIKFQLEAGNRDPELLRLAQAFILWFSSAESIYRNFKLRRSNFTVRYYYGLLQRILLGWAPDCRVKRPPILKEFSSGLDIGESWLATFTSTTNDGYFGAWKFSNYQKVPIETTYSKAILHYMSQTLKKIRPVPESSVEALTRSLEALQDRMIALLPDLLQGERTYLQFEAVMIRTLKRGVATMRKTQKGRSVTHKQRSRSRGQSRSSSPVRQTN